MKFIISVLKGFDVGKIQSFSEFPISIGRWTDNDFVLVDPLVSRMHCVIDFMRGNFYILDLKSANHTIVNEKFLISELPLANNDNIIIGSNHIKVMIED